MAASTVRSLALLVLGPYLLVDGAPKKTNSSVDEEFPTFDQKLSPIIGGDYADKNEVPYQVYVRVFYKSHIEFCGGAILDPRHILTAAHCVQRKSVKKVKIIAGDVNRKSDTAIKRNVVKIHYYQKNMTEGIVNDIALLLLGSALPLDFPNIKAVRLQKKRRYKSKDLCMVSGWGDSQDESNEDLLKLVYLPLVEQRLCKKVYNKEPTTDVICAGYMKGGRDTCQGDSGGPLVCNGRLTGVVKGGIGCGLPNYPGNFIEVAYYFPWITKMMCQDNINITYAAYNKFMYNSPQENLTYN